MADCEGRLRWVPMQVHAQVFPWEELGKHPGTSPGSIGDLLGELIDCGYVVHYEVDGKQYVEIVNFKKHQRLSGKELAYKSRIPPPPENLQKPNENKGETGEATGKHPGTSLGSNGNPLGTGEHRNRGTGEYTHTHTAAVIPKELEEPWRRWESFVMERHGRRIGAIEAETVLLELLGRGTQKATADIEFSIRKGAKTILDSDNDFEKHAAEKRTGKPQKKEIAW
jgi:hypothetical protein